MTLPPRIAAALLARETSPAARAKVTLPKAPFPLDAVSHDA